MAKETDSKKGLTLAVPLTGYPRTMRFNRFALESSKSLLLAHFGFITPQGVLCDTFSCSIAVADLKLNRESIIGYIERIAATPDVTPEGWAPPNIRELPMVRIVSASHSGENAEIALCTYSQSASLTLARTSGEKDKVHQAQPLALLSCDAMLQRYVLTKLFLENHG